jgi:hypothetical protein
MKGDLCVFIPLASAQKLAKNGWNGFKNAILWYKSSKNNEQWR